MEWLPVAIVLGVLLVVALIIIIAILVWGSDSGGGNNSGNGGTSNTNSNNQSSTQQENEAPSPSAPYPSHPSIPVMTIPEATASEILSSRPPSPLLEERTIESSHEEHPLNNLPFSIHTREEELEVLSQSSASDFLSSVTGCSQPVDLRSGSSSNSLPSTKEGSILASLCREEQRGTVCRSALDRVVTDICSFSSAVILVMSNGQVLKEENGQTQRVTSNLTPQRLEAYNGYLHCLYRGGIYRLDNFYFRTLKWVWKRVRALPENVTHISATLDGRNLWVQRGREGSLFNEQEDIVHHELLAEGGRRIYGASRSFYVDLVNGTAITSNGNIHHGVFEALLTYHNELIVIKSEDAAVYRGLRLVNWRHYVLGA